MEPGWDKVNRYLINVSGFFGLFFFFFPGHTGSLLLSLIVVSGDDSWLRCLGFLLQWLLLLQSTGFVELLILWNLLEPGIKPPFLELSD